jgi:hypothetical protein
MGLFSKFTLILGFPILMSGCAVYYHDAKTGAEHIWGIGHLVTKVTPPADGKQAVIRRATLTGLALGLDDDAFGFSAGWDRRERITVYDDNTSLAIQRPPSNDFFLFKIGTFPQQPPEESQNAPANTKENTP